MTDYVATLIAQPGNDPDLGAALAVVTAAVADPWVTWLSEGEAVDIGFTTYEDGLDQAAMRQAIAGRPVDLVVQPTAHRRKRLLVADMDSTMIAQECIDELADYAGFRSQVAEITERAMAGEIAFEPALYQRAKLLAGLSPAVVADVLDERITPNPGARTLIATMRANGATTLLVSGGFTVFAQPIADTIGFNAVRANTLMSENDRLTGVVADPLVGPEAKRAALLEETRRLDLEPDETLAVGDGANDIAMVQAAGLGVAYHAKPALREAAAAQIDHGDLTALLYLQGYRRTEFVEEFS
ncbi:MAG: phosphoserine phosphatase SerB [Hyphomicrobiales bacterium]|nr:phosphoserine phosphatase SerB [Hyphomicrobiales bacterium]